jgi:hypothetical protein
MSGNNVVRTALPVFALFLLNGCMMGGDTLDDPELGTLVENIALPPPTNLTGTAVAPNRIDISWSPVVAENLKYYIVDLGPAPGAEVTLTSVPPDKTIWISTNLTANTLYCWTVRTVTTSNEVSVRSNEVCLTTPATPVTLPPAQVTATAISASRISVTWAAVSGATVYHVFLAQVTGTGIGPFSQVASIAAPTTTFIAANLQPATTYAFQVTAVTANGESARSTPAATARTFQAGLEGHWRFDELAGAVAIDSSGFGRNATLASAVFSTDRPPANLDNRSALLISATPASQATVPSAGAFRFAGAAFSLSAWVNLPAATPTDIVGMRNASCGTLGWKLGQDATNQLHISGGGGTRSFGTSLSAGVWTQVAFAYDATTSTLALYVNGAQVATSAYAPANPLANTPLTFGHVGGCTGGSALIDELRIFSRTLSAAEIALLGSVPPATTLTVTAPDASHQILTWTAVPDVDFYYVYRGTAAGNEGFFTSVSGSQTTFTGQHLDALTQYSWFVRTTVGGEPFSTSNEVVISTPDVLPAPEPVTATPNTPSRITVTWTAVTGATSYKIFQSTSGGPFVQVGAVLTPTTSMQVANLTAKTTYAYQVLAVDGGANLGHLSTPVLATTR